MRKNFIQDDLLIIIIRSINDNLVCLRTSAPAPCTMLAVLLCWRLLSASPLCRLSVIWLAKLIPVLLFHVNY